MARQSRRQTGKRILRWRVTNAHTHWQLLLRRGKAAGRVAAIWASVPPQLCHCGRRRRQWGKGTVAATAVAVRCGCCRCFGLFGCCCRGCLHCYRRQCTIIRPLGSCRRCWRCQNGDQPIAGGRICANWFWGSTSSGHDDEPSAATAGCSSTLSAAQMVGLTMGAAVKRQRRADLNPDFHRPSALYMGAGRSARLIGRSGDDRRGPISVLSAGIACGARVWLCALVRTIWC